MRMGLLFGRALMRQLNPEAKADMMESCVQFNQDVYDRIKEEMINPEDDGKRDYNVNM